MRLHRFFIEEQIKENGDLNVSDTDLAHQLRRVFRFSKGEKVILFNGDGFDYLCEIVSFDNNVTFRILEKKENSSIPKIKVSLFASIIKKDLYEWILEKGTELGVTSFNPIISKRSEKKSLNYERARKILKEASEQSGRGTLPELQETCSLFHALEKFDMFFIACDPSGMKLGQGNIQFQISNFKENKIGILVGPEGGWTDNELTLFKEKNIPIYSLGKQILRAETAAIVVCAKFLI